MTRYSYLIFRAHERVWKHVSALVEITCQFNNGGLPFLVVVFYVVDVWFVFSYMAGRKLMAIKDMPGVMLSLFTCILSFYPPNNPVRS